MRTAGWSAWAKWFFRQRGPDARTKGARDPSVLLSYYSWKRVQCGALGTLKILKTMLTPHKAICSHEFLKATETEKKEKLNTSNDWMKAKA